MPVVPAGNLPYSGVPTVEPGFAPGNNYQNIRATADSFGAFQGRQLSELSNTLERSSDTLAKDAILVQEQLNTTKADDFTNKYQDLETRLLLGDPDKPGDTGYYGMKGEDAMRAMPQIREQLLKGREQLRATLQNDRQRHLFDSETRILQARTLANVGHHFVTESQTYGTAVQKAGIDNGMTKAAQGIARGDDTEWELGIGNAMKAAQKMLELNGQANNPEIVNSTFQKIRGDAVKIKAEGLAEKNPLAATEFVKNNIDALHGDEANQLLAKYRARAASLQADIDNGFAAPPKQLGATDKYDGKATPHINYGRSGALGDPNEPGWARRNLTKVSAPSGATFTVNKQAAADITGFLKELEGTGYSIDPHESGGHAHRNITNGIGLSEHAYGTAIDINPSRNPYSASGENRVTDLPANVKAIADKYNMEWGGTWKAPYDSMHFQWRGPAGQMAGRMQPAPDKVDNWEVRHNNFGGLRKPGVQAKTAEGGFQEFASPQEGVQAIVNNLHRYAAGGVVTATNPDGKPLNTLNDIIRVWAPPEENNTAQLIQAASKITGFEPNAPLDMSDPATMAKVTEAIVRNEHGGKLPVSPTIISNAAGQAPGLAAGNANATTLKPKLVQLASSSPDTLIPTPNKALPKLDWALPPLDQGELPDAQVPGMAEQLEKIMQNVPADEVERRNAAVKRARQVTNQQYQDQQRALRLHLEEVKQKGVAVQDEYLQRIGKGEMISEQQVLTDPRLNGNPATRENIVGFLRRPEKPDPDPGIDKANRLKLFERLNAPWGTEGKITDEKEIDQAYIGQQVSSASHDWLIKQFRDSRLLANENLNNMKKRLYDRVKPRIIGPYSGDTQKMMEGDAGDRLDNFLYHMDEKIQQYREQKKNPVDLFNPKSPEYLGSDEGLKGFESPTGKQQRESRQQKEAETGGDYSKTKDEDLIAGIKAGKIPPDKGLDELKKRGYTNKPATNPTTPSFLPGGLF